MDEYMKLTQEAEEELKKRIFQVQNGFEACRSATTKLHVKIDDLEKEKKYLKDDLLGDIDTLQAKVESLKEEIEELQMDLSEAAEENQKLINKIKLLEKTPKKYQNIQSVTGGHGYPWLITWFNPEEAPPLPKSVVYYDESPITALNRFLQYFRGVSNDGQYFISWNKLQELKIERAD